MKRKQKNGKHTEAAQGTTSQGSASHSQSQPQSVEAHNTPKISLVVPVSKASSGKSPLKAKGVGGTSAVHPSQKEDDDQRMSMASETRSGDCTMEYLGSAQAEEEPISMPEMVREAMEPVVEALHDIDLWGLPECPAGDTIRGLVWALEYAISQKVEPRGQHLVPFNLSISKEEVVCGRATIHEVWEICAALLCGLMFFQTHGHVTARGVEIPACWSPGDFCSVIEDARDALGRLEVLNDKLYNLKGGTLPKHTDKIGSSSAIPKTH